MDIYSKSTRVEVTIADMMEMVTDASRLESVARLLKEEGQCESVNIIVDAAKSITDFLERVEDAFNEEEGS